MYRERDSSCEARSHLCGRSLRGHRTACVRDEPIYFLSQADSSHPWISPTTVTGALTWTTLLSRISTSFVFSQISRRSASCSSCLRMSCSMHASRLNGAIPLQVFVVVDVERESEGVDAPVVGLQSCCRKPLPSGSDVRKQIQDSNNTVVLANHSTISF